MTETFCPNERIEQDLLETKTRNGYCFLQKIDALPNRLKLGMDVELYLKENPQRRKCKASRSSQQLISSWGCTCNN